MRREVAGGDPARRRDAALLEALVDGAPTAALLVSAAGEVAEVNRAAVELLGIPRGELLGRPLEQVFASPRLDAALIARTAARRTTVTRTVTISGVGHFLVQLRSISVEGQPGGFVTLTLQDASALTRLVRRAQETTTSDGQRWVDLRQMPIDEHAEDAIVARSTVMRAACERASDYALIDSPVLLLGETGTGKTTFARLIHRMSKRSGARFLQVNCAAVPDTLLEAELFGYAPGAFTGADPRGKQGILELANGGTLLLDEIGDMPLALQAKLLGFLDSGEVWPVGATKGRRCDVRLIAATNRDLADMIGKGLFRMDLFYRLHVLALRMPALRERSDDIEALVEQMLDRLAKACGRRKTVTPAALEALAGYAFPGNIRELWNFVERLVVLQRGDAIDVDDLPAEMRLREDAESVSATALRGSLRDTLRSIEAGIIKDALARYGSQTEAARQLGVSQPTIARKSRSLPPRRRRDAADPQII